MIRFYNYNGEALDIGRERNICGTFTTLNNKHYEK